MLKRGFILLVFLLFIQVSFAQSAQQDSCLLPSNENVRIVAQRILNIYSQIYDDEKKAVEAAIDSVNRFQPSGNVDPNWVLFRESLIGEIMRTSDILVQLEIEAVTHHSGSTYSWEGYYNGDYAPRTNEIFDTLETDTSNLIGGGFDPDPKVFSHLGTYVNKVPDDRINLLIEKFRNKIDIALLPALQHLLKDESSYIIFEHFFEDRGEIFAIIGGAGHGRYTPNPLVIQSGVRGDPISDAETLYHESLHYVFDKIDSVLSEVHDAAGADHLVIPSLEDRLKILQQINQGQIPIYDGENNGLYGFADTDKPGDVIKRYIDKNDLSGLKDYINSWGWYSFKREYVRFAMISPLSSNRYIDNHPKIEGQYKLSKGQLIDIAFLNAINGAIIQQAINIGISIANERSIKITEAFETKEFQDKFQKFLTRFTTELENPNIQPYTTASKIFIEDL